jgi:hypothetical protein
MGAIGLKQAMVVAEARNARYVFGIDMVGEQLVVAERVGEEEEDGGKWRVVEAEEIACLMVE